MSLLAQGVDTAVIALWLGHERVDTTQMYVHADMSIKERALARTAPPNTDTGAIPTNGLVARVPQRSLIILNRTPPSPAPTDSTQEPAT